MEIKSAQHYLYSLNERLEYAEGMTTCCSLKDLDELVLRSSYVGTHLTRPTDG
jgi:hypothetical protein